MTMAATARPRLDVGDPVPDLGWLDPTGQRVALSQSVYAGRMTVLLVCTSAAGPAAIEALSELRRLHAKFQALEVQVFAVTADPVAQNVLAIAALGLPFPILSDPKFAFGTALGLGPPAPPGSGRPHGPGCALVVDRNRRILRRIGPDAPGQAQAALAACEEGAAGGETSVISMQAPVLLVPNLLSPEHCTRLIRRWETGDRYEGGVAGADVGRNVPLSGVKVRGDVALPDLGQDAQELFAVFRRRLFPEIKKAHNFRVTRAETLRLGCYNASEGGRFIPHRDDTTPYTAHRRFAMSLNLNTGDYEGGYLRFPEYGPQLYVPSLGGAVVFSCSLLHEATPVTSGRRFVLLGFFYGEAEQALRDRINAEKQATDGPAQPARQSTGAEPPHRG